MANSVDPDQMPHSVASDLGLHCLQRPFCPNTYSYYGSLKKPGCYVHWTCQEVWTFCFRILGEDYNFPISRRKHYNGIYFRIVWQDQANEYPIRSKI